MNEVTFVLLGSAAVVILTVVIAAILVLKERQRSFNQQRAALAVHQAELLFAQQKHESSMKHQRTMQRAVHRGAAAELFAPFLPDFPVDHTEARHLGSPIDWICFSGLENPESEITIIFVEVKSGKSYRGSQLTDRESRVRAAVEAGRVKWLTYRTPGG